MAELILLAGLLALLGVSGAIVEPFLIWLLDEDGADRKGVEQK